MNEILGAPPMRLAEVLANCIDRRDLAYEDGQEDALDNTITALDGMCRIGMGYEDVLIYPVYIGNHTNIAFGDESAAGLYSWLTGGN